MSAVKGGTDQHVVALMDAAFRSVKRSLEGRGVFAIPGMRPSHLRLLSMVPREGIRLTDLAQRAGMTKQALGEFVAALENAGYVDVRVDPGDRRARLAHLTPTGVRQRAATDAAIVAAEKEWEDRIGTRRWAAFREVLAEIGHNLDRPD